MASTRGGALRTQAISVPSVFVAVVVSGGAVTAQAAPPFAPPAAIATFTLSSTAGCVDVNRDGAPDVLVPGIFGGTLTTNLDERGHGLAANGSGPALTPPPGTTQLPITIGLAAGAIDHDPLDDLMAVSSVGSVHCHRNLGAERLGAAEFAPDTLVDSFAAAFPVNPPFVAYRFPRVEVLDIDHDGNQDLLLAGGPNDRWSGLELPGFVGVYLGDGAGQFQVCRHTLPGGIVDAQFADLDGDGQRETIVALVEVGSSGAFVYELHHLVLANGTLTPSSPPHLVGAGRYTALALVDVLGDGHVDYLLARTQLSAGTTSAQLLCFAGDGQGHVDDLQWSTLWLPTGIGPTGDFVSALLAADFDRDGDQDLAVLRGRVQAPTSVFGTATYGDSELLFAMGPDLANASFAVVTLPGYHTFSSTNSHLFPLLPLAGEPGGLRLVDFDRDSSPDLVVPGLCALSGNATVLATLHNLTPPQPGDARFEKVGAPSGGVATAPARLGFEGGRPTPGNQQFACTVQNLRGGSLAGLVWGPVGQDSLWQTNGITLHLAPVLCGYATIVSGSGPRDGFHSYPLPIPNAPSLIGDAGYFQYVYFDPASSTFGGTQATGVWIGG